MLIFAEAWRWIGLAAQLATATQTVPANWGSADKLSWVKCSRLALLRVGEAEMKLLKQKVKKWN